MLGCLFPKKTQIPFKEVVWWRTSSKRFLFGSSIWLPKMLMYHSIRSFWYFCWKLWWMNWRFPKLFFFGGGGWRLAVESLRYEGLDRWKVKLSTMIAVCPGKLTWQSFQEEMYRNISSKGLWRCMFHCHVCLAKGYMNLNVYSWWFRNSKPRTWDGHKTRR